MIKRDSEIIYTDPPKCIEERYTKYSYVPKVERRVESDEFIAEKLSTGDVYVQYREVFTELDKAFSNWEVGSLFLLTGPPRTGKSYAPKYFAKKWGREVKVITPDLVLIKWLGDTEKRVAKYFSWVRSTNGVLVFDEGEVLVARRGFSFKNNSIVSAMLAKAHEHIEDNHRGVVVLTTNVPTELVDQAAVASGRFKALRIPLPTQKMLKIYAELTGLEFKAGAKTMAELKKGAGVYTDVDYEVLPPYTAQPVGVSVSEEVGVYTAAVSPIHALLVAWGYFGGSRQVWYIYGDRDPKFVINALEDSGAVGVVDDRVGQSYVKHAKPLARGLLIIPHHGSEKLPVVKIRYDRDQQLVKLVKMLRPCANTEDIKIAFWRRCP